MKQLLLILFLFFQHQLFSQELEVNGPNNKRKNTLLISKGVAYTATLIGLNSLWYKDYLVAIFILLMIMEEWLQMDKLGHITSSYNIEKLE